MIRRGPAHPGIGPGHDEKDFSGRLSAAADGDDEKRVACPRKPQALRDPSIVKGPHESCRQPESLNLEKKVLAGMARLDVGVPLAAGSVFAFGPCVFGREYEQDGRPGHPALAEAGLGQGFSKIPGGDLLEPVARRQIAIDTGLQAFDTAFARDKKHIERIQSAGGRCGPKAPSRIRYALGGPQKLGYFLDLQGPWCERSPGPSGGEAVIDREATGPLRMRQGTNLLGLLLLLRAARRPEKQRGQAKRWDQEQTDPHLRSALHGFRAR